MTEKVTTSNPAVWLQLQQLGHVNELDAWILHELKEIRLAKHINVCEGIVYFELLPRNQTIDSNVYCLQSSKLNNNFMKKRPKVAYRQGVMIHHANARPLTSLMSRQKITQLNGELVPHPPYSPDLSPSDYHSFRSLQNHLSGKTFGWDQAVQDMLHQFLAFKNKGSSEVELLSLSKDDKRSSNKLVDISWLMVAVNMYGWTHFEIMIRRR